MDRNQIIENALAKPNDAIRRALTSGIRTARPEKHLAEVHDLYGDCFRFAEKGHCKLHALPDMAEDSRLGVFQGRIHGSPQVAWWQIEWQNALLEVVQCPITDGYHRHAYVVLMADTGETIREFLVALEAFTSNVEGAVLVFQDGCWHHDEDLYADIQSSTFCNLVLPTGMADQVRDDVQNWLDARELYERHGVPWKRGMILVGPPGNGKTHMIKALVNHFGLSALYVRGFSSECASDSDNISAVFRRARACAPSMLILEDLDTLVNSENRSHFLNELDGFALNTGILAVASANDPARLDPALVNRPSRFDRRYAFSLPEAPERIRYLQFFTSSLDSNLRLTDSDAARIGDLAEGFSYAYLKELVLSSMMAWISANANQPFVAIMEEHVQPLLEQMSIDPEPTLALIEVDNKSMNHSRMRAMRQNMMRWGG